MVKYARFLIGAVMTITPVYTTFTPTKTPIKFFMAGLTFLIAHISHADDGRTDNQEPINQEIATLNPSLTMLSLSYCPMVH